MHNVIKKARLRISHNPANEICAENWIIVSAFIHSIQAIEITNGLTGTYSNSQGIFNYKYYRRGFNLK